jgi:hypothetical protein
VDARQFDTQTIQNELGTDATAKDRVPYLMMASIKLGHPFVPPALLNKVNPPADWITAASSYVRVAQTWPEYYLGTPIRQLKEILDRGRLIQNALASASNPDVGGELLQGLFQEYQHDIDELGPEITTVMGKLDLEDQNIRAGEHWSDEVRVCPSPHNAHYPSSDPKRAVPAVPAVAPPDARVAQRLSLGTFDWCFFVDNVKGGGTEKPYEALLIGRLKVAPDMSLNISRRYLQTADSPAQPRLYVPGGVACCYWQPELEPFLAAQWIKLLPQLALPQTDEAGKGELATNIKDDYWLKNYPDETERFSSLPKEAVSDKIYQVVESDSSLIKRTGRFETISLLIRAFAERSISTEVQGNDALHALVGNSSGLFGRSAILSSKANRISGPNLAQAGARRGEAANQLIKRAFLSRAANAPEPTTLERTISLVEQFYEGQVSLCRDGKKPVAAC